MSLADKVVLITGAARGLGFEYARFLGEAGARDDATVFLVTPLRPLGWHRIVPTLIRGLVQVYRVRDMVDEYRLRRTAV